ncbi:MAG: carboxypeptidase-like regulatory domain-containing protein, partial [Acidobacteria bacterium]|nr:carboxypeptidase-like regulatory domain-containing protein [Acidobacteriota bacterium]
MSRRILGYFELCVWVCLLLAPGLAPGAAAQELRGQIVGVVTDSTGGALPGVTVTVTGQALIQPQTTVTGSDGGYRLPPLPPGDYSVVFELSQFQTERREGIQLTLRAVLKVNASLAPAGVSAEVNVVAGAPVVDVKSTAMGTSFSKELLTSIPTARDLWSAMALAPGFSMSGVDVGGSHIGSQTRTQSYGVNGYTRTLIEGIISNNSRTSNSAYLDYGSLQEYELGASGSMGEAAGPGSLLNFAVKSGADSFHGSALAYYQNDSLRTLNVPDALATPGGKDEDGFVAPPGGIGDSNSIASMYDLNGDLGGPIVRGKARFYVSLRDNDIFSTVAGLPGVKIESRLSNATAKVNYSFNARNSLVGFYTWRYKLDSDRGISAAVPRESARNQDGRMHLAKLEWTSILTNRLFLDLQAGWHKATNFYTPPVDG